MLLKTIPEIKKILGFIQNGISPGQVLPYIEQAELQYVIPLIGLEFFQEIQDEYDAAGEMDAKWQKVYDVLIRPIAYYALLEAIPFLNVQLGNNGLMEGTPANATPIRQWSYNNLELAASQKGDLFLDAALLFLEQNADDYSTWAASEACTKSRELFFNNASELSRHLSIQGSRRAYLAFRPFLIRAEDLYIRPFIGDEQFDALKAGIAAGELEAEELILIDKIRKPLAQLAFYEGHLELSLNLAGTGLSVLNDSFSIRQRLASSQSDVVALGVKAQTLGERYLTELRQFLDRNASSYPLYESSDQYQDPEAGTSYELPENEAGSPSFRV